MTKKQFARKQKILWRKLKKSSKYLLHHSYRLFSLLVIAAFFLLFPGNSYYETLEVTYRPPLVRASEYADFVPAPYPQKIGSEPAPYTTGESVVITVWESGVPMHELNPTKRLRPASITKLMTALVALDYYSLDQVLTVKRLAPPIPGEKESEMGLAVGDNISVRNLLYGLLIPSGNDAAYTLADNYEGGIENFIYSMNKKAKQLHMENTQFQNPVGIDGPEHYSSARDLSLLAAQSLKNDLIAKIVATSGVSLGDASGKKVYTMRNVNQLLGYVYGVDGVKTGFTDEAGQCLISSVSRNGHRIIIVLLKSQDRFGESAKLIEWVFGNYKWVDLTTGTGV